MITKKETGYYSSLLKKKYRTIEQKFLAEGKKIVQEGIKSSFWIKNLEVIFLTNEFLKKESGWVKTILNERVNSNRIKIIKKSELNKLADSVNPQGIVAVFKMISGKPSPPENELVCMENISDPGNVGTIIRNCDWFGLTEIILGEGCADIYNPKTIRASAGSIFHLKINIEAGHIKFLSDLKKAHYKIITADLNGKSIYNFTKPEKFVIVFSNEANGPSQSLLEISDEIVSVPKKGNAESLNVSSASAVILSMLNKE